MKFFYASDKVVLTGPSVPLEAERPLLGAIAQGGVVPVQPAHNLGPAHSSEHIRIKDISRL